MPKFFAIVGLINTAVATIAASELAPSLPSDLARASLDTYPQFNHTQWKRYHCLTLDRFKSWLPKSAHYCEDYTLRGLKGWWEFGRDGCHEDDFPCHCARSQVISEIIEPCIFPWLNKSATITKPELAVVQTWVTDSCKFFNATGYADYTGCDAKINKQIYEDIKVGTAPVPKGKRNEYECYYKEGANGRKKEY